MVIAGSTSPWEVFLKAERQHSGLRPNVEWKWPGFLAASLSHWQWPSLSRHLVSGISWAWVLGKFFSVGFVEKKKALRTLCVCVCMCVAYYTSNIFKNLRTNQNRFHSRNIICHLWWRLFITFKVEITLHQVFYNSSYFGGLRVGKQIII